MAKNYFSLAIKNLRHRGIRTWLTMLGIFIGIAAVVSLISMGQGLREAVTGQFSALSADRLIVQNAETGFGPPGSTAVKKLNEKDIRIIESIDGVKSVIPRILRLVKTEYNSVLKFNYAASMPEDKKKIEIIYSSFNIEAELGRLLNENDKGKIVLGSDFLDNGEFGKPLRLKSKLKIQGKEFEVLGFLKKTSTFQVNSAILMSEDDMNEILNINNEYDLIAVQVSDKNKIEEISEEISRKFRQDRNEKLGEESFTIQTPLQALGTINTILNIINIIVSGIAAISLLVGGIGIANTMYTSVLERTREIGTMKAIGAKNKDILIIFLIESGLLGAIGGIVGAVLGLGFAYFASIGVNAYFDSNIFVPQISLPLLFSAIAFSFLIGIASGVLPALQGSKLKPVEALRK